MPFFSVIIPTYNRYKCLKRAIDSVLNQTFQDYELIIIDDGSTDETHLIESEYGRRLIYRKQGNAGVSRARNNGILVSSSQYISFLDSDDIWLPHKLESQYNYIKKNPDILIHQTDEIWIRDGQRVNPRLKHKKKEGDIFIDSLNLCLISPSSVVIHRDIFDRRGFFDENLPVCEDYDLWLRITWKEPVGLIPEQLIVKYGGHGDQLSKNYWGMDRYRVYSILKLLHNHGSELNLIKLNNARGVAREKCNILLLGSLKRGRAEFANYIRSIIDYIDGCNSNKIDFQNLLKI